MERLVGRLEKCLLKRKEKSVRSTCTFPIKIGFNSVSIYRILVLFGEWALWDGNVVIPVAGLDKLSCDAIKESLMAPLTFFQFGAPTYTQNQAWIWKNVGPDKIKISRPIILCVRHD